MSDSLHQFDENPPLTAGERYGRTACPKCASGGRHRVTGFAGGALVACAVCGHNWDVQDRPAHGGAP